MMTKFLFQLIVAFLSFLNLTSAVTTAPAVTPNCYTASSTYVSGVAVQCTKCCCTGSISLSTQINSIGISAFAGCTIASVTIPSSVTLIGNQAFSNCSSLASVSFVAGSVLNQIGNAVFLNNLILTYVNLEATRLQSIGISAFFNCKMLSKVQLPSFLTSISDNGFSYSGLQFIMIPTSVVSVGANVFYGCTVLSSVIIPSSLTSIGATAFGAATMTPCLPLVQTQSDVFIDQSLPKNVVGLVLCKIKSYTLSGE